MKRPPIKLTPHRMTAHDVIRRLFASWLAAVFFGVAFLPYEKWSLEGLSGLAAMSFTGTLVTVAAAFAFFSLLSLLADTAVIERWAMFASFTATAVICNTVSYSTPLLCASVAVITALFFYGVHGNFKITDVSPRRLKLTVAALTVLLAVFFAADGIVRIHNLRMATYDFGIFAQMFSFMKTTGLPYTTLERDMLLSHFAVHVSPVYYLLLPFYFILPRPETLTVLQSLMLAASVIPLWKLAKKHGYTDACAALFCATLLLSPAFFGGALTGLHENFFLAPFILWLFYAVDTKNTPLTVIFSMLTLSVKEDAAVYVAVIALWLLARSAARKELPDRKRNIIVGGVMLAAALAWFFAVTAYLSSSGLGVMTDRYDNLIYDGSGSLFTVVKAAAMSPLKVLYECADPEKLTYVALTLLPLCGLPLFSRKYENLILIIPYLLVNLMSDYEYQHGMFWQYSFGSLVILTYAAMLNLRDISDAIPKLFHTVVDKRERITAVFRKYTLTVASVTAAVCFLAIIPEETLTQYYYAAENREDIDAISEILDSIPNDVPVAASSMYTVRLSDTPELYDLCFTTPEHLLSCEYIVTDNDGDVRYLYGFTDESISYGELTALIEENGYTAVQNYKNKLTLYKKP